MPDKMKLAQDEAKMSEDAAKLDQTKERMYIQAIRCADKALDIMCEMHGYVPDEAMENIRIFHNLAGKLGIVLE